MKKLKNFAIIILVLVLFMNVNALAQDSKKYAMFETSYMMPKMGMEKEFIAAVKSHNMKFHKDGPYQAKLWNCVTGHHAGWYMWDMGPVTFTELDSRPNKGMHDKDWNKNVEPFVKKYGMVEYWKYNKKLSYDNGNKNPKYLDIWFLDVKRGDFYRFKEVMKKVKAVHEKDAKDTMGVYTNAFTSNDGRQIAIIWPFKNWAHFDDDDNFKKNYESLYGEGSFQDLLDEWREISESITQVVWKDVSN